MITAKRISLAVICATLVFGNEAPASPSQDLQQFASGQKFTFDSNGHKKAKGIQVTIEYPTSWKPEEGVRPDVVQNITGRSEDGRLLQCILAIRKTSLLMRLVEKDLVAPDSMRDMAKEMGAEYIGGDTIKIDGQPAGWMELTQDREHSGVKITMYSLWYMMPYNGRLVLVQFMAVGSPGDVRTRQVFSSYLPLFHAMANTIRFPEKCTSTNTMAAIINLVLNLLLGLILSWAVGLAPALIYRHAIYRKPIPRKEVFLRLAPAVVVLMFVFKLTMARLTDSEPNANPLPWIIVYYIGKWIMTRKRKCKPDGSVLPMQQESAEKRKPGTECPRCGYELPEADWRCPECYFEFNNDGLARDGILRGGPGN